MITHVDLIKSNSRKTVILAKAGIHWFYATKFKMDSRVRGNDGLVVKNENKFNLKA